jgi:hypothetical protein
LGMFILKDIPAIRNCWVRSQFPKKPSRNIPHIAPQHKTGVTTVTWTPPTFTSCQHTCECVRKTAFYVYTNFRRVFCFTILA